MNIIVCAARLARWPKRRRRQLENQTEIPATIRDNTGRDVWFLYAAAAVSLSGQLEDATIDDDLFLAMEHFASLVRMGVMDEDKWNEEALAVGVALAEYGQHMEEAENRVAHGVHAFQCLPSKGGA